jgi:hypothetical protein
MRSYTLYNNGTEELDIIVLKKLEQEEIILFQNFALILERHVLLGLGIEDRLSIISEQQKYS